MDACRSPTRLSVTGTFQKENEVPLSGGSRECCTATAFSHGTNLELKHAVLPLILLYFSCSSDKASFLLMISSLKYGLHYTA